MKKWPLILVIYLFFSTRSEASTPTAKCDQYTATVTSSIHGGAMFGFGGVSSQLQFSVICADGTHLILFEGITKLPPKCFLYYPECVSWCHIEPCQEEE